MCETCGCTTGESGGLTVEVQESLLAANNAQAKKNRDHIHRLGALCVNIISGPGSGKTSLLEATIEALGAGVRTAVIEGDIETERDADRIRKKGVPAVQLTTGGSCHLDARLVHRGLHMLEEQLEGDRLDILFIENVGNLVCPATFDLGEDFRVVMVSVPEGSDKPAKYPRAFTGSSVFIISKIDLLPHFDFSVQEATEEARRLNPDIFTLLHSSVTGEGMDRWESLLRSRIRVSQG